jgi:hypothetical protein
MNDNAYLNNPRLAVHLYHRRYNQIFLGGVRIVILSACGSGLELEELREA